MTFQGFAVVSPIVGSPNLKNLQIYTKKKDFPFILGYDL
jgi:hypothetical protein